MEQRPSVRASCSSASSFSSCWDSWRLRAMASAAKSVKSMVLLFLQGQGRHGEEGSGIEISQAGSWMHLPTAGFYHPSDFPGPCCSLQSSFAWFRTLLD